MAFEPNDPRINRTGRPANPDKAFEKVVDLLGKLKFHPAKELVRMYRTTKNENLKVKILIELQRFLEGKKADQKDPPSPKKPESPEESRKNAEKQAELLKQLEADAQKPKE